MTINDLCCDVCGRLLAGLSGRPGPGGRPDAGSPGQPGPAGRPGRSGGVRFVYHPGKLEFRDDSGLACETCWTDAVGGFDVATAPRRCAACGEPVTHTASLHLRRFDDPRPWQLCARDAAGFLNRLRTVQPKLDPATFRFPAGSTPPRVPREH